MSLRPDFASEPDVQPVELRPGRVTRFVAQQKNPNRVSIFIEDEFAFGVYRDVLHRYQLTKGMVLSIETQEQILEADRGLVAYQVALRYLAHRARTVHEVRTKLERRGFSGGMVEQVLQRLVDARYLDDVAYAEAYVQTRLSSKGYGPRRLWTELMRRGVDRATIEHVLKAMVETVDTVALARRQAEKRWPRLERESDLRKRRKKLYDYLLRRGFDFDTARQVSEEFDR